MSRRLSVGLAVGALVVGVGGAAMADATTQQVKSHIKITEGRPDLFKGKVTSKRAACEKRRRVRLFYRAGKGDMIIGKARTDSHGRWSMPGTYEAGAYHVEVQRKRVADEAITMECGFASGYFEEGETFPDVVR
jgi:hypothetical protein